MTTGAGQNVSSGPQRFAISQEFAGDPPAAPRRLAALCSVTL